MENETEVQAEPEVTVEEVAAEEPHLNAATLAEMEAGRAHLARLAVSTTAETA